MAAPVVAYVIAHLPNGLRRRWQDQALQQVAVDDLQSSHNATKDALAAAAQGPTPKRGLSLVTLQKAALSAGYGQAVGSAAAWPRANQYLCRSCCSLSFVHSLQTFMDAASGDAKEGAVLTISGNNLLIDVSPLRWCAVPKASITCR